MLHRWIGLLLAVVVLAVAVSGGLLLFRGPYYRAVLPVVNAPLTADQHARRAAVLAGIESRWQDEGVRLIRFPRPGMNVFQVWLADGTEAFVHPLEGAVIDRWHWSDRFPAFVFELHAHLLSEPAGTAINGVAALGVVFMGLSGILFWWPGRRRAFRLRRAVPRRLAAADMLRSHGASGAIVLVQLVVFAATGAALVFYDEAAAVASRLLDDRPAERPVARVTPRAAAPQPWAAVLEELDSIFPDGETVFYYPGAPENPRLMFRKRLPGEWHPNGRSYVLIDPYTAKGVQAIDARAQGAGTRLMHAIYPIHAARVGGVSMGALALSASAGLAWLSAGGVWSYLGRRRRTSAQPAGAGALPAAGVAASTGAVRLRDLPVGFTGRLHEARIDPESRSLLRALGLTDASLLRVCKQGEPCVVQVRTTRIGISGRIAQHVMVVPAAGTTGSQPL
jgi:uncharacterized iron-regulated membrane protein